MNFKLEKINVPLWLILTAAILLAIAGLGVWYYHLEPSRTKAIGIVGGIVTGLTVYLATFLTLLRPIQELDRYHRMGIKGLLSNRHEKKYYRDIVANSKRCIDVMGSSCSRFVQDFLDIDSDDKVLVDALNKHQQLRVRLLIPSEKHMSEDARNRTSNMLKQLSAVQTRFSGRIELRRFNDVALHSFVLADTDLIAGPVFDGDKSRHAPAVHVLAETAFGQKHCEYFEALWNASSASA